MFEISKVNYDPSNGPFPPVIESPAMKLSRCSIPGGNDIEYRNGYLYLISASNGGSLRILRCNDGEPTVISELNGLGNMRQLEISDELSPGRVIAAVTARECGMYLIDVTNPEKPFIACHYDTVEFATGITFAGKYIAIGCRQFGVELVDASNPEKPRHICSISAGEVQSVFISDGILYTGSWGERQVTVIDIKNVRDPKTIATIPLEGRGDGIYVEDGILYAAFGQHRRPSSGRNPDEEGYGRGNGFAIWDVRDPLHPKQLSTTFLPYRYYCIEWDMWDVTVCGHYAVLSLSFNGVWIYDISDLTSPRLVDHAAFPTDVTMDKIITVNEMTLKVNPMIFPFDPTKCSYAPVVGVAASDGRLYVSLVKENLYIAEADYFKEPTAPTASVSEYGDDYYEKNPGSGTENVKIAKASGQTHAVLYDGGLLYAACGMGGIDVYDTDLNLLANIPVPGFALDIRKIGENIAVAAGKAGILIYRPDGTSLHEIGRLSLDGKACAQVVPSANGKFLAVHAGNQLLTILDVSAPENPRVAMRDCHSPGLLYNRQISYEGVNGQYYGCYWNGNLTRWYDLSGDEPVRTEFAQGSLSFFEGLTGLDEPYRALSTVAGGYVIIDIRDDKRYYNYPIYRVPEIKFAGKPVVKDGKLYVSSRPCGQVAVCDITTPDTPKVLFSAEFSGEPDLPCPIPDGVIIPLGHQGLAKILI